MAELKKSLTLFTLTMIAIGSCIGSGIFRTPGTKVAAFLPDSTLALSVWVLGGVITLTGALTFAELGTIFTKRGGMYVYQKEAYGDITAFMYGWSLLFVTNTGSIAGLAAAFSDFLSVLIPIDYVCFHIGSWALNFKTVVALLAIITITLINVIGIDYSKFFTNIFTSAKLLGIFAIIFIGIFLAPKLPDVPPSVMENIHTPSGFNLITAYLTALVGVLWAYGGWQHASFLSGETINPSKTVPRAMIIGAIVVTAVYILINIAYLRLLPINQIITSKQIATDAVSSLYPQAGKWIAVLITISVFGTAGIYTLSCPRIYFAMAEDKIFFPSLAKVHPKFKTPANAIIVQSIWASCLLLFWGTFEDLIDYVTFVDWIFYALTGAAVFIFRKKLANITRTYKVPLYPFVPLIFVIISSAFVINALFQNYVQAIAGIIVMLMGFPLYYYFKKKIIQ
ncbi:MAG: amino acid permease [Saprospiraceae bacterium]|nr:amino acid permease [Saprospiraceae bacterium]